jgi:hypothetical protein
MAVKLGINERLQRIARDVDVIINSVERTSAWLNWQSKMIAALATCPTYSPPELERRPVGRPRKESFEESFEEINARLNALDAEIKNGTHVHTYDSERQRCGRCGVPMSGPV